MIEEANDLSNYMAAIDRHFPNQRTLEGVVLRYGKSFMPPTIARPKGIQKGRDKQCFSNAYRLVDKHDNLRYVEGFAVSSRVAIPLQHAWVIDEKDMVIETTWRKPGKAYFGIVFELAFMHRVMLETRHYGILDYTSKVFRERYVEIK